MRPTHHSPVEVVTAVDVAEGAEPGVEGAMADARVARLEGEVVDGDVAAVPPSLVGLILRYCFDDQL